MSFQKELTCQEASILNNVACAPGLRPPAEACAEPSVALPQSFDFLLIQTSWKLKWGSGLRLTWPVTHADCEPEGKATCGLPATNTGLTLTEEGGHMGGSLNT